MMMNRLAQFVVLGASLATLHQAWGAEAPLLLENPRVAVEIDPESGALRSIRDKKLDALYPQQTG